MSRKKKGSRLKLSFISLICFLVIFAGTFFGVQFFTKTGIFRIPGVVYLDGPFDEETESILNSIFTEDVDLDKDVHISTYSSFSKANLSEGEYLYKIYVPVSDFYDLTTGITAETPDELFTNESDGFSLVEFNDLDYKKHLLKLNDAYYLDDFEKGAVFGIIKFESENFNDEILPLIGDTFVIDVPSKENVLTFAQTGVTALSRGMNRKLYAGTDAKYFAAGIKDFLSAFDLTHTSNESSFTNYASGSNICSDPRFIDTLTEIGLDIVELTGNHNQDCGDVAASSTIDLYNEKGIKMVGGGKTATDAAKPLKINEKGTGITFLAYNQSTGGATYDNTPGANQYYEENAAAEISAAKTRGDFVIVDIQYYECASYDFTYENAICDRANSSAGDQIGFFRHLIDLGADVVVGTSAHQAQTYELYGNGAIYYGLGNLFFDQIWWPGTTRSLVLGHYFYNGKLLQTKLTGTIYGNDMQTKILDEETMRWWLQRLQSVRP